MTVHYAIWPEGMPQAARFTTSSIQAFTIQNAMGIAFAFPFRSAKRIRVARDLESAPDPHEVEEAISRSELLRRGHAAA